MPDHPDLTGGTPGGESMDGTLEGVERVDLSVVSRDGERVGVVVSAGFAGGHRAGEKREGMESGATQGPENG